VFTDSTSLSSKAVASMAVPDTLGAGGVLVNDIDYESVARELHRFLHDEDLRARLVKAGHENLERFAPQRVARAVIDGIASVSTR
jgi:glycosyltransferase involved in cell wall biosynthesis